MLGSCGGARAGAASSAISAPPCESPSTLRMANLMCASNSSASPNLAERNSPPPPPPPKVVTDIACSPPSIPTSKDRTFPMAAANCDRESNAERGSHSTRSRSGRRRSSSSQRERRCGNGVEVRGRERVWRKGHGKGIIWTIPRA